MLVVVSGPEKAGKTTFCRYLEREHGFLYRKWGPIPESVDIPHPIGRFRAAGRTLTVPGDWLYLKALQEDLPGILEHGHHVVWDRGWPCESVYSVALKRGRRLDDAWLGEWYYGRALRTIGQGIILLGPSADALFRGRTPEDLPVEPSLERALYEQYGVMNGWLTLTNRHEPGQVEGLAELVVKKGRTLPHYPRAVPPYYVGPPTPRVVFVSEVRNPNDPMWLPFSTPMATRYGEVLGPDALHCGWTNVEDLDRAAEVLRDATLVVACGEVAYRSAKPIKGPYVLSVPHPSALYRWGKYRREAARVEEVEATIRRHVSQALAGKTPEEGRLER